MPRHPLRLTAVAVAVTLGIGGLAAWLLHKRENDPLAGPPAAHVSFGVLSDVPVWRPAEPGPPRAVVIYFSTSDDDYPAALARAGAAVLVVDAADYIAKLSADVLAHHGECIYAAGDLGDLAKLAEQQLGLTDYLQPIFAGDGVGASLAYAAFADAPPNSLTGALGSGFANSLPLPMGFCPGPTVTKLPDGTLKHGLDRHLEGRAALFLPEEMLAEARTAAAGNPDLDLEALGSDAPAQLAAALDRLAPRDAAERLPVTRLPALGPDGKPAAPRAVAVVLSGDGGWRDIDKSLGETLAADGLQVEGLDSLRYFWTRREPARIASDLGRMVAEADPTGQLPVLLAGYSFGADALPFAVPLLPEALRNRVQLVALLAPGRTTDFRIHVGGWLGLQAGQSDIPAAIAALRPDRTLCVYGNDDAGNSGCTDPRVASIPQQKTAGGHHFDGDYKALARLLLARMVQ